MRIVPTTLDHPLRQLWHTRGIGASSAEVILKGRIQYGRAKVETALERWKYLTYKIDKEPQTEAMLEGLSYEPTMMKLWEEQPGIGAGEPVNIIDDEYDFLRAQIDWLSYDGTVACDFKFTRSEWLWNKLHARNFLLEDDPWFVAAQHQLALLGLKGIFYFVMLNGLDTRTFFVQRDQTLIDRLRAQEVHFWREYVQKDRPPPSGEIKVVRD